MTPQAVNPGRHWLFDLTGNTHCLRTAGSSRLRKGHFHGGWCWLVSSPLESYIYTMVDPSRQIDRMSWSVGWYKCLCSLDQTLSWKQFLQALAEQGIAIVNPHVESGPKQSCCHRLTIRLPSFLNAFSARKALSIFSCGCIYSCIKLDLVLLLVWDHQKANKTKTIEFQVSISCPNTCGRAVGDESPCETILQSPDIGPVVSRYVRCAIDRACLSRHIHLLQQ